MKCRYCAFEVFAVDKMKSHLRDTHPDEYREVNKYLNKVHEETGRKEESARLLKNGKSVPQTNWGVFGSRI